LGLKPEQIFHGNVQSDGNPPQRAGARESGFSALDLVESRAGDLGAIGQFVGAPTLGVPDITHSLS
jgi:hypothetical protein